VISHVPSKQALTSVPSAALRVGDGAGSAGLGDAARVALGVVLGVGDCSAGLSAGSSAEQPTRARVSATAANAREDISGMA
jgi:hypothetical protein